MLFNATSLASCCSSACPAGSFELSEPLSEPVFSVSLPAASSLPVSVLPGLLLPESVLSGFYYLDFISRISLCLNHFGLHKLLVNFFSGTVSNSYLDIIFLGPVRSTCHLKVDSTICVIRFNYHEVCRQMVTTISRAIKRPSCVFSCYSLLCFKLFHLYV